MGTALGAEEGMARRLELEAFREVAGEEEAAEAGVPRPRVDAVQGDRLAPSEGETSHVLAELFGGLAEDAIHLLEIAGLLLHELVVLLHELVRLEKDGLTRRGYLVDYALDAAPEIRAQCQDGAAIPDGRSVRLEQGPRLGILEEGLG